MQMNVLAHVWTWDPGHNDVVAPGKALQMEVDHVRHI